MNKTTHTIDYALRADSFPAFLHALAENDLEFAVRGQDPAVTDNASGERHCLRTCGRLTPFVRALARWDRGEYTLDLTRSEYQLLALRIEWVVRSNYREDIPPDQFKRFSEYQFELPRGTIHDILELAFRGRGNPFEDFCRRCNEAIAAAESPYSVH